MSAVNCSACGTPFPDGTIDTTGVGILCDACLEGGAVDDSLAVPKRVALGAVGVLVASQVVSIRSTHTTESTFNGHGERTVTNSADFAQLAGLTVAVAMIAVGIATVLRPLTQPELRSRSVRLAVGFVVLALVALWRVSAALPSSVTIPL